MMKYFRTLACVMAAALFVSCGSVQEAGKSGVSGKEALPSDGNVASGTLDNGISWFFAKNSEPENRLFLRLVVKAGSILEDDDQKGVAHFVEHMAFNGTARFAKNELVDYFESVGMSFGPEVNAYTSFDETVYMLEIPSDDLSVLRKSMEVLEDWASAVSFDQEELDKERGVVVEEWRLGRGANGRVLDKEIPFLFNGSRYGARLPIGDPEIVKTVSRKRVTDFYERWYRPDLMSVVIVGNADQALIENEINATLGTIPKAKGKAKRPYWPVKDRKDAGVLVIRDPELPYVMAQLMEQYPADSFATVGDFRGKLVQEIAFSVFNSRLSEKTLVADPAMLAAGAGNQRIAKPTFFNSTAMIPATGKFGEALDQMLGEITRLEQFGITAAELERAKQSMLDSVKQTWLNRDKYHSSNYAQGIADYVLYGETVLSVQDRYDLCNRIVPEITVAEVADAIGEWYTGKGKMLLVTAPESAADIPDDAALLSMWQGWKPAAPLEAYAEGNLDRPLFTATGGRGAIVKEEKLADGGIGAWTLSNGARVVLFPTDNKSNEVLFSAFSKGGLSLSSDADYPSAIVATSFAQMSGLNGFSATDLRKKLSGKTVSVNPWIDESWEGLYGSSSVGDFGTLCQLVSLEFTAPAFTSDGWQSLYAQLKTVSESRSKEPDEMFADLKVRLLYGDNIRRSNLTPALVAAMDRAKAESSYRARFADAGDFTFLFVGSIDEAALREFAETVLATLPSSGAREEARDTGISFPAGITEDSLSMGLDPQAKVSISFGGVSEIGEGDFELFDMMCSLLEIRLREVIREDLSGSYGVNVSGSLANYPKNRYEIGISFGCEPARVDELSRAVFDQIRWMQGAPVDGKYVTKLRENYRRSREEGLTNNNFWLNQIMNRMMTGRSLDGIPATDAVLAQITGDRLQKMALEYFDNGNYVRATLVPQKSAK